MRARSRRSRRIVEAAAMECQSRGRRAGDAVRPATGCRRRCFAGRAFRASRRWRHSWARTSPTMITDRADELGPLTESYREQYRSSTYRPATLAPRQPPTDSNGPPRARSCGASGATNPESCAPRRPESQTCCDDAWNPPQISGARSLDETHAFSRFVSPRQHELDRSTGLAAAIQREKLRRRTGGPQSNDFVSLDHRRPAAPEA